MNWKLRETFKGCWKTGASPYSIYSPFLFLLFWPLVSLQVHQRSAHNFLLYFRLYFWCIFSCIFLLILASSAFASSLKVCAQLSLSYFRSGSSSSAFRTLSRSHLFRVWSLAGPSLDVDTKANIRASPALDFTNARAYLTSETKHRHGNILCNLKLNFKLNLDVSRSELQCHGQNEGEPRRCVSRFLFQNILYFRFFAVRLIVFFTRGWSIL